MKIEKKDIGKFKTIDKQFIKKSLTQIKLTKNILKQEDNDTSQN